MSMHAPCNSKEGRRKEGTNERTELYLLQRQQVYDHYKWQSQKNTCTKSSSSDDTVANTDSYIVVIAAPGEGEEGGVRANEMWTKTNTSYRHIRD